VAHRCALVLLKSLQNPTSQTGGQIMVIDKKMKAKAWRARQALNKIAPDQFSLFAKIICLAIECGINPYAPSKRPVNAAKVR
jgi:hypothetical protein